MRLRVEVGGEEIELSPEDSPVTVGRSPACRVRLSHPLVSRQHGRFCWRGDRWIYEDRSRHGTLVARSGEGSVPERLVGAAVAVPRACELLLAGDREALLTCRLADPNREDSPSAVFRQAVTARGRGDLREALERFLSLARREPPVAEAMRRAAECLEVLGRSPDALVWGARYALLRPADPVAWKLLARLYALRGELDDARGCLARARAADPSDPEVAEIERRLEAATPAAAVLELSTAAVLGASIPHLLETPHFAVRCDFAAHGRLLPDLVKGLEAAVRAAEPYVPIPRERVPVELLSRFPMPEESARFGARAVAATCDAAGIQVFLPPTRARAWRDAPHLVGLALHEVVHALLLRLSPGFPWWLHEGLAQWLSTGGVHEGCLPAPTEPADLSRYEGSPGAEEAEFAYALAHFAAEELHRRVGRDGVRRLLEALASGSSPGAALKGLGLPYPSLGKGAWALWRRRAPPEAEHEITLSHLPRRSP